MQELEKLAELLYAKVFILSHQTNQFVPYIGTVFTDTQRFKSIIKQTTCPTDGVYHSVSYAQGYFLSINVPSDSAIIFWFDYGNVASQFNELMMLSTLTNLKSVSQIIYSMYTSLTAPDDILHLHHLGGSNISKNPSDKFDSAAYFKIETNIIKAIVYSQQDKLVESLNVLSDIQLFDKTIKNKDYFRLQKNYLLSYLAVLNRAIIQWGYPASLAFKMHYELIKEIESIKQIPSFFQVLQGIAWHYFQTIKKYRTSTFLPLPDRIKSYVNEHIGENITLNDISSALHASKKTLNPAFKKAHGITITQFIRSQKIIVAKELLISCDSSIADISELLSFSTQSYFVKTFRELTGVTPKYFREHYFSQHLHL